MADEYPYEEVPANPYSESGPARITVHPLKRQPDIDSMELGTGFPAASPEPPPEDYNPWERAATRLRDSNVGKIPTPEFDWLEAGKKFRESAAETGVHGLKSWEETLQGRYFPPDAKYIGDDGKFRDENNEVIPDQKKPQIAPVTMDPRTGETQLAMPGITDMMNTIGSPVKGVATLGAGFTRGAHAPHPPPNMPPPGMGHNQGPPMPPGGGLPPPGAGPGVGPPPPPGVAPPPLVPPGRQIIHGLDTTPPVTAADVYTKTLDDLHPIKVLQDKIAQAGALAPGEQAYELARLTRGSYGRTQQALDNATFDFHTLQNNGRGLKDVLKPVRNNLDDFEKYTVALRDMEKRNQGVVTGADYVDAANRIANAPPAYRAAAKQLHAYQDRILQYLGDSGLLSPEALANMRAANREYVPFYRATDAEMSDLLSSPNSIKTWQPIQKMKGSTKDILSPIESIVRNTHKFIDLAEKNRALNALVDSAEARGLHGLVERVQGTGRGYRGAEDEIKVWKKGVPHFYKVDPDVAVAVNGMGRQEVDMVMRLISAPARTLRAGAVLAPAFLAKNIVRDQASAGVFSKNNYVPFYDYLRGVGHMVFKTNRYQNFLKSGGANSNLVTMERHYVRDQLQQMRESGWYDKIKNNTNPLKFLEKASEYSEQPTRVAEFVRSQKRGKTIHEGGFDAREVSVDFGRHGASQALRAASQSTAFLNPTIQGHDRLARALFTEKRFLPVAFRIGAYVTLPTLMAYAYNRSDPRMKDISRQERDTFTHWPTDDWHPITKEQAATVPSGWKGKAGNQDYVNLGTIYKIPKAHEMGVLFGSSVERTLDAYFAKDPDAFKGFYKSLASAVLPPMLMNAVLAPVEAWTNYKFFTESPLVPKRLQSPKDRRYEYTPWTTETAKAVGNVIGQVLPESHLASPIVLENYTQNWFGTLGRHTLQISDALLEGGKRTYSAVSGNGRKPVEKPDWSEADYPVWNAFVSRMPSTAAVPIRDFYENLENSTTTKALISRLARSPDYETDQQREAAINQITNDRVAIRMAKTSVALGNMFRQLEIISKAPADKMSSSDKRKAMDMLTLQMTFAAGEANKAYNGAQEANKASKAVPQ